MKYTIECEEIEVWDRIYSVEANSQKEAEEKLCKGKWDDCLYGETTKTEMKIKSIRTEKEIEEDNG